MSKNEITPINQSFLENVSEVLAQARKNANIRCLEYSRGNRF